MLRIQYGGVRNQMHVFSCGPDLGVLVVDRLSVGVTRGGGVSMGDRLLPVGILLHVVVVAAVASHLASHVVRGRHRIWAITKPRARRLVRPRG